MARAGQEREDLAERGVDRRAAANGASVALEVALRHPGRVRRLVFASSMTRRDGARPELWEFIARAELANMPKPLKDAFLRVNPDPRQLRTMHDKDAERMKTFQDVPDARLRTLRAPTLIVLGDRDIVRPDHAVELTRIIPHARLLILPGGHGDYIGEATAPEAGMHDPEVAVRLIEGFLNAGEV
jgi:pimeloyl-ACP methyl ester carboxylesterase